jgi:hypothetical protein
MNIDPQKLGGRMQRQSSLTPTQPPTFQFRRPVASLAPADGLHPKGLIALAKEAAR